MTHHEAVAAATERVEEEGGEKDKDVERAGGGNRTRIASLEGWSSAIELRPLGLQNSCLRNRSRPRRE
jgi:hypothetical protein